MRKTSTLGDYSTLGTIVPGLSSSSSLEEEEEDNLGTIEINTPFLKVSPSPGETWSEEEKKEEPEPEEGLEGIEWAKDVREGRGVSEVVERPDTKSEVKTAFGTAEEESEPFRNSLSSSDQGPENIREGRSKDGNDEEVSLDSKSSGLSAEGTGEYSSASKASEQPVGQESTSAAAPPASDAALPVPAASLPATAASSAPASPRRRGKRRSIPYAERLWNEWQARFLPSERRAFGLTHTLKESETILALREIEKSGVPYKNLSDVLQQALGNYDLNKNPMRMPVKHFNYFHNFFVNAADRYHHITRALANLGTPYRDGHRRERVILDYEAEAYPKEESQFEEFLLAVHDEFGLTDAILEDPDLRNHVARIAVNHFGYDRTQLIEINRYIANFLSELKGDPK
jgi:hypothetical protein